MEQRTKVQRLSGFDYGICAFGVLATLLVLGIFGDAPLPLIFMVQWIAALICLLSLSRLVVNLFIRFLEPTEQRAFLYPMLCNLIPTLHFLSRLRETPWERFAF